MIDNFSVEYYQAEDGTFPVEEFILSQDVKMRAKIFKILELLEIKGNELREPYSKCLGDGIFEVRAKTGTNTTRILYFFVIGNKVILTNGFVKKVKKTPRKEIELAKKYRTDYLSRNKGE